jgi:hypothetical protein
LRRLGAAIGALYIQERDMHKAELLLGRSVRNRLPDLHHTDAAYKKRMKEYADKRRRTKEHTILVGDWVLLKKEKKLMRKTEPFYETEPYRVIAVNYSMITARNQRHAVTRNCAFFKKLEGGVRAEEESGLPPDDIAEPPAQQRRERGKQRRQLQPERDQPQGERRSTRKRGAPRYFDDYETNLKK